MPCPCREPGNPCVEWVGAGQRSLPVNILFSRIYVSPRVRPLTAAEAETRRLAYALKIPTQDALAVAAPEMAALLPKRCVLVPVPSSSGSVEVNFALCRAMTRHLRHAVVIPMLARSRPVDSSCIRSKLNLPRLSVKEHCMVALRFQVPKAPVFFVDNVTTSGNTLKAAHAALGYGDAVVFANACHH